MSTKKKGRKKKGKIRSAKGRRLTKRQKAARKGARTRAAKKAKRRAAAKKAAAKRKRKGGKRKSTRKGRKKAGRKAKRNGRRRSRKVRRNGRRRRRSKARRNGRRRKTRRNARRNVRRNRRRYRRNGFMADVKSLLKQGSLVLGGFVLHKALTSAVCRLTDRFFAPAAPTAGLGQMAALAAWQRPICGGLVAALGVVVLSKTPVKAETKQLLGAGMVVSFLQNLLSTGLTAINQPQLASYLSGVGQLPRHGYRRTIMPGYTPVRGVGMGQTFMQAAAGMGRLRGMGEYFASSGVRGVGNYEKAGPLALLPSMSAMGQLPIDDGIRPDSNLDAVLDLAESAAGLGQGFTQAAAGMGRFRRGARGVGEYFTAVPSNGGFAESVVPRQDQWIPNGPVWAPTVPADASQADSTLPAGILAGPGGNGVLSG